MPAIINSDDGVVSGSSGLKTSGANDGILALQNNGTTNVTVTAAGNVGIGTSSPSGASGVTLAINGGAGQTRLALKNTASGDTSSDGFQIALLSDGVNVIYQNRESGYQAWENGGTERMRIDSSGNLGIGTASPVGKVESKTATVAGGSADYAQKAFVANIPYSTTNVISSLLSGWDGSSIHGVDVGYTYNGTGYNLIFSTNDNTSGNPIERARIDSSGNLLVGTTSSGNPNPGIKLAPGFNSQITVGHDSSSGSGQYYMPFYWNGSLIGGITQNGTTAVAYNTTSDYRLKENVQPLTGALARVAALKPVTYTWKAAPEEIGEGFIAHELAEVCPQAVTGEKDAVETYTDEEGNEQTRPKYQGIDTSFLVATLTAAIQELKAELDATKAEVAALKAAAK